MPGYSSRWAEDVVSSFFLFYFYFLLFLIWFWFSISPTQEEEEEKEILDGGQTFSFLAIFIWFGSSSFLFFERSDIASYRLSLQISQRENVQFHWVFSIDLFAIRNGFLIRFWFCFFFFSFLLLWNVHFFTIGRRHLYTDSQNSLWDVWLHQPKPL